MQGRQIFMSRLATKIFRSATFAKNHGIRRFARELHYRTVEHCHERRLGVETARRVRLSDIGASNPDSRDSMPIGYAAFYSTLQSVPLPTSRIVFLDYGVGTGRAICAAATFPLDRIIGIDISETLVNSALENLNRMRHRQVTRVELRTIDAAEYKVPSDVNLIYFFNPFAGETLRRVVANICDSCHEHPRKIYIMYFNNDHFDRVVVDQPWLSKLSQTQFYPNISCGLYETRMELGHPADSRPTPLPGFGSAVTRHGSIA
jgi:hypothetical protein